MRNHGYAILASCLMHALVVLTAVGVSTWPPEAVGRIDLTLLPGLATVTAESALRALPESAPVPAPSPAPSAITAKAEAPVLLPHAQAPAAPRAAVVVQEPVCLPSSPPPALLAVAPARPARADPPPVEAAPGENPATPVRPLPPAQSEMTGNPTAEPDSARNPRSGGHYAVSQPSAAIAQTETAMAILARLRRFVEYPDQARRSGWEGKVVLSFRLGPDGEARDVSVVTSSGFPLLDRSALRALRRASPFPCCPGQETELLLPVVYALR